MPVIRSLKSPLAGVSQPDAQLGPDLRAKRAVGRDTSAPVWLLVALVLCGSVCRVHAAPGSSYVVLHSFGDGSVANDGEHPYAGLVQGANGNFYGTTYSGESSAGAVFEITPSGAVTILHLFGNGSVTDDGENPYSGLFQASNGDFYGTTWGGGSAFGGAVFSITSTDAVTILHSFGDGSVPNDGEGPYAGLIEGSDGNYYGTTQVGGAARYGAAFKMSPSGAMTILHSFSDGSVANDGETPYAGLIQGSDGNFYGTTYFGGSTSYGVAFKMTPSGAVTILHSFHDGSVSSDGEGPYGGLIQGSDGDFYGTTYYGGSANDGTVFKMTGSGAMTILHSFGDGSVASDGENPNAGLILGSDGNYYGTTHFGGSAAVGAAFKMTPAGVVTILHSFGDGTVANDGTWPLAGLIEGTNGSFYGTTYQGGSDDMGAVFELVFAPAVPAAPSGLTATAGSAQVSLSWSASTGATSYDVYRGTATGAESTSPLATGITTTGYTNTGLTNGDKYFYKVSAVNAGGTSAESNEASATPTAPVAGTVHVLWSNGAFALWNYNPTTGAYTQNSNGPFAGWTAKAIADGPDGMTRVLWVSTAGAASIWTVNGATGAYTQYTFGPYKDWTPLALSVGSNNTTHILWTSTSGAASIWNYNTSTGAFTQNSFGPYGGWTANAIGDGPDGVTRVVWGNGAGTASIWSLNAGTGAFTQYLFSPFNGWGVTAVSVNAANTTHVLWTSTTGAASLWNLNSSNDTYTQNQLGPYAGWTAASIADGSDGNTQVLWDDSDTSSIWDVNDTTGAFTQHTFGPFPGWTATALSAYP
ncbi:MAG: choice-of-anchor tandem repeat GloVer-containing protein [Capsulimonadaceae bacterium]